MDGPSKLKNLLGNVVRFVDLIDKRWANIDVIELVILGGREYCPRKTYA